MPRRFPLNLPAAAPLLQLALVVLTGIAPSTIRAQEAPARNGRFTVAWKPASNDGLIRIRGEAKGILHVATHGDSATVRLEMTQRADGQASSEVQTFPAHWRADTLVFTQTANAQANAAGQQMPIAASSDWRVLIVGDELRGTVAIHLPGIILDVPPFLVVGRRERPPEALHQPAAANACSSQPRNSASTCATSGVSG